MVVIFSRSHELSAQSNEKVPRCTSPASFFGMSVYRLVILVLLVLTVPTLTEANLVNSCVDNYDANVDYFPNKIKIDRAGDYAVEYFKHYKVVTNSRTNEEAVLYQCGTPVPTGFPNDTKIFAVPVSSVGFSSTTEITFLEVLGVQKTIKYSDSLEYVSSPCVQKLVIDGFIQPFNSTIKPQQISSLDIHFVFSKSANPKQMSVSSSADTSPLGRAEWIKYLSLFFNREETAEQAFNQTKNRYDCFSKAFKSTFISPKVAWVSYESYDKTTPYYISNAKYKTNYILEVGATPIVLEIGKFANVDDWKKAVEDVDYVIDETYMGYMDEFYKNFNLTADSPFKFIKNKQVWKSDRLQSSLGALDWFESALYEVDSVIQDLGVIFKPEVPHNHTRIWFRNIAKGEEVEVQDARQCKSTDGPRPSRDEICEFDLADSAQLALPSAILALVLSALYLLA